MLSVLDWVKGIGLLKFVVMLELGEFELMYPVLRGGSRFLHFALLFWNHTCTLDSLRFNFKANSSRANTSGYGARSNARSSSSSWKAVNVVLEKMKIY